MCDLITWWNNAQAVGQSLAPSLVWLWVDSWRRCSLCYTFSQMDVHCIVHCTWSIDGLSMSTAMDLVTSHWRSWDGSGNMWQCSNMPPLYMFGRNYLCHYFSPRNTHGQCRSPSQGRRFTRDFTCTTKHRPRTAPVCASDGLLISLRSELLHPNSMFFQRCWMLGKATLTHCYKGCSASPEE